MFDKIEQGKRFGLVRKKLKKSQTQLSKELGGEQAYYSMIESGNRALSYNIIEGISLCYKEGTGETLSLDWLLLGEGEMSLSNKCPQIISGGNNFINFSKNNGQQTNGNTNLDFSESSEFTKIIRQKDDEIIGLRAQVEILTALLKSKS